MTQLLLTIGVRLLTANAMRKLAVVALFELSKRTSTKVDDVAVEVLAEVLGVDLEKVNGN